ncbi:Uncharacterized protein Fot_17971 [Forsythia ovata]|uniref:Uncharacterized protein n=1 Tax=Forsythia ovata TaxID=205694 RepID=A0ABD1VGU8_9LAMI
MKKAKKYIILLWRLIKLIFCHIHFHDHPEEEVQETPLKFLAIPLANLQKIQEVKETSPEVPGTPPGGGSKYPNDKVSFPKILLQNDIDSEILDAIEISVLALSF